MSEDTDGVVSLMMEESGAAVAAPVVDRAEAQARIRMRARDVNVFYGDKQALFDVDIDLAQNKVTALIGPVRLRQVDLYSLPQPHERHHRHLPGDGLDYARRPRHLWPGHRRGAAPGARRHGVSEAQSLPQVDLRECRLRPAHTWARQQGQRTRRHRRGEPAPCGPLRRSLGPAATAGNQPLGRAAAAALHSRAPSPSAPR